jgi:hypothetical protein
VKFDLQNELVMYKNKLGKWIWLSVGLIWDTLDNYNNTNKYYKIKYASKFPRIDQVKMAGRSVSRNRGQVSNNPYDSKLVDVNNM